MRRIQKGKGLVGFAIALGAVAIVTGCSSSSSSKSTEPSLYSSPSSSYSATASPSGAWYASGGTGASAATQSSTSAPMSQGEISIPLYEEQLSVTTRPVESGSVRLRKQVTTETVNQPVQIRRETLVVERAAGAGGQGASSESSGTFTPFEQKEIVIKLHSEEPVIEKRVVATGRIVARTSTNSEQVTVSREIRKENIDVEKIGNPQNVTISDNIGAKPSDAVGGTGTGSQQTTGSSQTPNKGAQDPGSDKTPAKPIDNGTAPDGKGTLK